MFRILSLLILLNVSAYGQNIISGKVTDTKGNPLPGANIYLQNSYDGASSNSSGDFSFTTDKTGNQTLVVSVMGFDTLEKEISLNGHLKLSLKLKEAFNSLKAVTISAGAMEASDEKRSVVFKPLDIVTTPGANGDIVGALNTLPGTATVGNDGRLFVRGGDASETALFFDGLKVNNAYGSSLSGIPTRTRFSPQLFTGTFFSTGGYSAEYGQALSSALVLSTVKMPLRSQTDLSLMSVGASAAHTQVMKNSAVTATLGYNDLSPYQSLVPQNIEFDRAPHNFTGELLYRYQFNSRSLVKAFYSHQRGGMSIQRSQPGNDSSTQIKLSNGFHYGNANWEHAFNKELKLYTGASYSFNEDHILLDTADFTQREKLLHTKAKLSWIPTNRLTLNTGIEHFQNRFEQLLESQNRSIDLPNTALYSEGRYHLSETVALQTGLRAEYNGEDFKLMPRISAAFQVGKDQQVNLAYGQFFQRQKTEFLVQQAHLKQALATHYIANYQLSNDERTLRVEFYHKKYDHLLTTTSELATNGGGYARGFDLFYRERELVYATDFWVTYSFTDSQRKFGEFSEQVQPGFAPRHNASIVAKHWVEKLNSQIGAAFSINDGYAYDNPNLPGEQESKTKFFHSLNLNWSYLPKPNLILHAAVSNVLGRENIFGYRYSEAPAANGQFTEMAVGQAAKRFFLVGVFLTLSSDKKANQLNNL